MNEQHEAMQQAQDDAKIEATQEGVRMQNAHGGELVINEGLVMYRKVLWALPERKTP